MKIKNIITTAIFLTALVLSCANQAAPGGGPEDKEPPEVDYSFPEHGEVNVDPRARIRIEFSEWINVNVASAVAMYPPPPGGIVVKGVKNRIVITPREPLNANTTYHVVVGTSLKDLRGNSPERPLSVVFSTGAELDSGKLDGVIMPLGKLTAMPRVALFREEGEWSNARYFASPDYAAHSDSSGVFSVSFLREGNYRVAAFVDHYRVGRMHHGDTCFTPVEQTVAVTKAGRTVRLYPALADTTEARADTVSSLDDTLSARDDGAGLTDKPDMVDKAGKIDKKAPPEEPDTLGPELRAHTPSGTVSLLPELRLIWSKPARVAVDTAAAVDTAGTDTVAFYRASGTTYSDTALFTPAKRLRPGTVYNIVIPAEAVTDKHGNHAVAKTVPAVRAGAAAADTGKAGQRADGAGGNDTAAAANAAAVDTAAQKDSAATVAAADAGGVDTAAVVDTADTKAIKISLRTVPADSICYRFHGGAECLGEDSSRKWVYSPFGWKERFTVQDKSGTFTYDSIPASRGTLYWFADDNGDNSITIGKLAPWRAPERFFFVPDTVEAKARWEVEDMGINAGCER